MEPASTYFTRRARQQRLKAAESVSSQARRAHLELAFRYVRVATESPPSDPTLEDAPAPREADQHHPRVSGDEIGKAVAAVFSLPPSGAFKDLLEAIDESERRTQR